MTLPRALVRTLLLLLLLLQWCAALTASSSSSFSTNSLKSLSKPLRLFQSKSNAVPVASPPSSFVSAPDVALMQSQSKKKRIGVLLLNLGGPEKQEDVEGFLYNLFSDPDIIQLPRPPCPLGLLQKPLAFAISKNRAKKSAAAYQSIGGGSPIKKYTTAQAEGLRQNLVDMGYSKAKTYFAMRYWEPYTEDVLAQIKRDGIQELVIIPLYPHYSISTSASSLKIIKAIFEKDPKAWFKGKGSGLIERATVVPYWYNRPEYITAMAELVAEKYAEFTPQQQREGVDVLYSAHGVPQSYIASGDPYKQQMEDCVRLISTKLGELVNEAVVGTTGKLESSEATAELMRVDTFLPASNGTFEARPLSVSSSSSSSVTTAVGTPVSAVRSLRCQLAFQSRVGPVEWLRPYTDDKLREMGAGEGAQGKVKNLIVVPVAFVSEHIETLEEIDIEYRELAEASGIENWKRAPALNTNARFLKDLASMTEEALLSPDISIADTLISQLLPSTKKKSKFPYAILGLLGTATFGSLIGPHLQRKLMEFYSKLFK